MKRFVAAMATILIAAIVLSGGYAFAAPGDTNDPLITRSYLVYYVGQQKQAVQKNLDALSARFTETEAQVKDLDLRISSLAARYKDVPDTYAWASDIYFLTQKGILTPYPDGTFRPEVDVTRAQLAVWLVRAIGVPLNAPDPGFKDVPRTNPDYAYIAVAKASGIIRGYDPYTFRPDNKITRGEMAVMIARAFSLPASTSKPTFKDVSPSQATADGIQRLVAAGITNGYKDNTFRPTMATPRKHTVAFIARVMDPARRVSISQ
ncbi:MAG: S-layer homology domain-containing protein [Bacillota bacterium]